MIDCKPCLIDDGYKKKECNTCEIRLLNAKEILYDLISLGNGEFKKVIKI